MCKKRRIIVYHKLFNNDKHPILSLEQLRDLGYKYKTFVLSLGGVKLSVLLLLYVILLVKSNYSIWYFLLYTILIITEFYALIRVVTNIENWTREEFYFMLHSGLGDLCEVCGSCSSTSRDTLSIIRYRSVLFVLTCMSALFMIRPIEVYSDKFAPPTNSSCCTNVQNAVPSDIFNPEGYFTTGSNRYEKNIQRKLCPMNQAYAGPSLCDYVLGYKSSPLSPLGNTVCKSALEVLTDKSVNGYVDGNTGTSASDVTVCENPSYYGNNIPPNQYTAYCKLQSYPSPVLGIATPVTLASWRPQIELCRCNTNSNVCLSIATGLPLTDSDDSTIPCDPAYGRILRRGFPLKICPTCLNDYRRQTGDYIGPPGYEHCDKFNPNSPVNYWCTACPYYFSEPFDADTVSILFGISIAYTGVGVLDFILFGLVAFLIRYEVEDYGGENRLLGGGGNCDSLKDAEREKLLGSL